MSDVADYVADRIRYWVWSGFNSPYEDDVLLGDLECEYENSEEFDESALQAAVAAEWERKRQAEATWPATTDCDRLDAAFGALHGQGICALQNAGYTQSDGHEDVAEFVDEAPAGTYHGYCYYHGQDVERAVDGHGLWVAFGDLEGDDEDGVTVGHTVTKALQDAGFAVEWDGTIRTRIAIPVLSWQRRMVDS